jgi:hypothetical protein
LSAVTNKNPDLVVFDKPLNTPGKIYHYDGKNVEIRKGGTFGQMIVVGGTVKLCGEVDIGEIVISDPRLQGACTDGIYFQGTTGQLGVLATLATQRDMIKMGSGTHDLMIGSWIGRAVALEDTDFPPGHPPHRDGLQGANLARVTFGYVDVENLFPGATNGGFWLNPQKAGGKVDPTDPTLVTDLVIEGGTITFPNAPIHLGYCTRCGARNTKLNGQRPFRVNAGAVDPIDDNNTKTVINLSGTDYAEE